MDIDNVADGGNNEIVERNVTEVEPDSTLVFDVC